MDDEQYDYFVDAIRQALNAMPDDSEFDIEAFLEAVSFMMIWIVLCTDNPIATLERYFAGMCKYIAVQELA